MGTSRAESDDALLSFRFVIPSRTERDGHPSSRKQTPGTHAHVLPRAPPQAKRKPKAQIARNGLVWHNTTGPRHTCTHPDSIPTHSHAAVHTCDTQARVDAEGPKQKEAEEAVDGGGCVVCLGGVVNFCLAAGRPGRGSGSRAGLVLGCELSLLPDGESIEQSIVLGFETAWRGLERETKGLCSGSGSTTSDVRRPTFSRGCTNQPVKAPRAAKGGLIPLFSALLGRRRIKGSVCLMRCHACISMLQAGGGKTSSVLARPQRPDCPLNNRGPLPPCRR